MTIVKTDKFAGLPELEEIRQELELLESGIINCKRRINGLIEAAAGAGEGSGEAEARDGDPLEALSGEGCIAAATEVAPEAFDEDFGVPESDDAAEVVGMAAAEAGGSLEWDAADDTIGGDERDSEESAVTENAAIASETAAVADAGEAVEVADATESDLDVSEAANCEQREAAGSEQAESEEAEQSVAEVAEAEADAAMAECNPNWEVAVEDLPGSESVENLAVETSVVEAAGKVDTEAEVEVEADAVPNDKAEIGDVIAGAEVAKRRSFASRFLVSALLIAVAAASAMVGLPMDAIRL